MNASRRQPMPQSAGGFSDFLELHFGARRGKVDFQVAAGEVANNSAVAACVRWIATNWTQAMPEVRRKNGKGEWEPIPHPLTDLLLRPSPYYGAKRMYKALLRDYFGPGKGSAYLYIVTSPSGIPVELQYLPARCMKPVSEGNDFITRFDYRISGNTVPLPWNRVLHFCEGMDPANPARSIDPLQAVLPEVATDNVATTSQYNLLEEGGVPPWVIGPAGNDKDGVVATLTKEDGDYIKEQVREKTKKKEGLVMPAGFKFEKIAFDPKSMVLGETQRKAEERIAAQTGIPPVVAGLGAGLDRSTFNNYEEARQAAWEDCEIPLQDDWADEMTTKLIPLFGDDPSRVRLFWNREQVRCLRDDESARAKDAWELYRAGVIDRAQAKRRAGEAALPEDEGIYAVSGSRTGEEDEGDATGDEEATPPAGSKKAVLRLASLKKVPTGSKSLEAVLAAYRKALRGREAAAVQGMSDALSLVEARILADLDALLAKMEAAAEAGEPITVAWLEQEAQYKALLKQIEQEYRRFAEDAAPGLESAQEAYVATTADSTEAIARAAAGPEPEGVTLAWNKLPSAAIEAIVGAASDGSPLAELLSEIGEETIKAVRDALIAGIGAGYNPRKTAALMRASTEAKLALSRARAETIARTETLRAAREVSRQTFMANKSVLEGWVWTATMDRRTCAGCMAMHGSLHPVNEKLDDHPNGRCVAVPRTKSWAQLTGDDSLPDTRPLIEEGANIFTGMSDSDQRAVMGDALHVLYRDGAITLADCVVQTSDARWGSMRRAATVEEAKANAAARTGF